MNNTVFTQTAPIGRPTIVNDDIIDRINSMTLNNRRMGTRTIANIISETIPISYGTVYKIRKSQGFNYLPPRNTFFLTDAQKQNRINFAQFHIQNETDWKKVLFVDESYFY